MYCIAVHIQGDTKKTGTFEKPPTKIEEMQQKNFY
jgi:hypothetical protein